MNTSVSGCNNTQWINFRGSEHKTTHFCTPRNLIRVRYIQLQMQYGQKQVAIYMYIQLAITICIWCYISFHCTLSHDVNCQSREPALFPRGDKDSSGALDLTEFISMFDKLLDGQEMSRYALHASLQHYTSAYHLCIINKTHEIRIQLSIETSYSSYSY